MYRFHRWRAQIQDAYSEKAIARIIEDYRLTLSPVMVESLPEACRDSLSNPDVANAAFTLLQAEMSFKGPPEVKAMLHEIANTYAAASVRVAGFRSAG
jgi:hypothetical protein